MASKGFEFIQGNERLDWGVLVAIDVERLMSSSKSGDPISTGANIDTLQRIVENIAFSRITHDEAKLFTADHVLHLFQLAQFVIQYLVYCQDTLATMNVRLSSRTEENERRLSRLEQQRHALENDNAKLRKDVKSMRRTLVAYENTQHLLENNYKYQNRFPRRYHSNPHMPARRMEPFCHTSNQRRRSNITHPSGYYTTDDYDAHYDSETEYDDNGYVQGVRHTHTAQNGNNQYYYYNNKVNQPMKQCRSDRQRSREEPTMQYICQWCGDGYHKIESLQSHLRKRHASRVLDSNVTENNNVEHKANSTQPLPPQMQQKEKNYKDSKLNDRHISHNQYSFEQENERRKREQYQNSDNEDDEGEEGKKTSKELERLEEELNRMKDELHKSKLMEMEKREQLLLSLLQQKSADRVEVETHKPITIPPTPTPHNNYESDNKVTTSTLAEPVIPPLALPGLPSPNTYVQSQEAQKQFHTNHKHQHQQEELHKENKEHEMANTTQFVTSPERHSLVQRATTTTRGSGVGNNNYNTYQGKENSANINFVDSTENRIHSIPVMPDVEAASAYNTTRAHELTNNALMRQMLELQDEIKALKIGTSDEHTHSAMPVNKVEGAPPLHVTLPVPHYTVPQPAGPSYILTPTFATTTSSSIAPAQRTEQVQDEDREAINLAKYGPPGPSFVPPEILSRRSLSLSGSANKMIESSPTPQTVTAATVATIQQPQEQELKHHDKQEATPHHHNHREHERHTHHHTHHKEEEKQESKEQEKLLQQTERSIEPNATAKVLQPSLVVPSSNALPTPVPVLPTNIPSSAGQTEQEHKRGSINADNKMIAIKKINDTDDRNNKNKNALLSTSSSTLSSTGTSYSSSSSSSSYSTSASQTSSTSLSKSTMPPSSVQPTSLSIPIAPSTINAIPVPIPTIHSNNNNNNFFQPTLPQESKIQQPELIQHSEHVQQSQKLKKEEAKQKEEHHHHKHKREQEKQEEQRKTSAIPIPVPINPAVVTTGISSNNSKTNLISKPAVTPSPYATALYMTGIASNKTVGSKLDHNNSHLNVAHPAKVNQSDKEKTSNTANNIGSSNNNKQGLLATLKITPPPDSHSSSLSSSSSSSSYSASSSGSSESSGSYSYSSSGSYSSSSSSSTSKDKVQTISITTAENRSNIVASNTYLNNIKGNEQYSSSSSYSYEQKSS